MEQAEKATAVAAATNIKFNARDLFARDDARERRAREHSESVHRDHFAWLTASGAKIEFNLANVRRAFGWKSGTALVVAQGSDWLAIREWSDEDGDEVKKTLAVNDGRATLSVNYSEFAKTLGIKRRQSRSLARDEEEHILYILANSESEDTTEDANEDESEGANE